MFDVGRRGVEVRDHVRRRRRPGRRGRRRRRPRTRPARASPRGQPTPKNRRPGDHDEADLDERVGHRVGRDAGQVGAARQRRPAHALEHALLAQEGDVHGQRAERRRHDAHAGDARHDHVEVVLVALEDRAEQREEQQRQDEVEERRRRVAPEHPALQAVLVPGEDGRVSHARPRALRSARGRRPRASGRDTDRSRRTSPRASAALVSWCSSAVGVGRLALLQLAVLVAPGHAVARPALLAGAELGRRPDGEDAPVLDDRHAVAQRLGLVEVVRGEQDRLAELLQRADRLPRGAPRRRVEAGGRLVEEDQLGVADEREREVQPPQPGRPRACAPARRRLSCSPARASTSSTSRGAG